MLTDSLVKVALLGAEWVLYLLVLLSVLSIALVIERLIIFWRAGRALSVLESRVLGLAGKVDPSSVDLAKTAEGKLLEANKEALQNGAADDHDLLTAQLQGLSNSYRRHLERFTPFLGTLGNNAPFIGLFGTVIGVIMAFNALEANVKGAAADVMGGISEALVATAAGIAVAIPAVVAYNFFMARVEEYVERFDLIAWTRARGGKES